MTKEMERLYDTCLMDGRITDGEPGDACLDRDIQDIKGDDAKRYGCLKDLAEGLLLAEGTNTADDQALFACLCVRHPEYDLDWETLEGFRLMQERGGAGNAFITLRIDVYLRTLQEELRKRIGQA